MSYHEILLEAYSLGLCIDFYCNTITDSEGNEWYWTGGMMEDFQETFKQVLEDLKK